MNFLNRFSKYTQTSNFKKIHPVRVKLFHRQRVRQIHRTKLIVTFHSFANLPNDTHIPKFNTLNNKLNVFKGFYLMVHIQHGCKVQELTVLVNLMQVKEDYSIESFSWSHSGHIHGRNYTLHHWYFRFKGFCQEFHSLILFRCHDTNLVCSLWMNKKKGLSQHEQYELS